MLTGYPKYYFNLYSYSVSIATPESLLKNTALNIYLSYVAYLLRYPVHLHSTKCVPHILNRIIR
jgi:hypothetical protein